jgi:uncharacterized protein (DUF1697 family)
MPVHVALIRGINVGRRNRLAMADLRRVLADLGHTDVRTHLNSGNATFESSRRSAKALADEIEQALRQQLRLDVRCCVRRDEELRKALDEVPDLPGYVVINVLFARPAAAALRAFLATDWAPEVVTGDDQVLYMGFADAAKTKLTNARIEKALGVSATARTPATLRKLLT